MAKEFCDNDRLLSLNDRAAVTAARCIHSQSASLSLMEDKMTYPKHLKWVLALSCLLLINSGVFAAKSSEGNDQDLININTATSEELVGIPGVGKVLAKRIIDFREKNGPFQKVEDLMKIRGIGEKNFKKMRDSITVGKKSKKKS